MIRNNEFNLEENLRIAGIDPLVDRDVATPEPAIADPVAGNFLTADDADGDNVPSVGPAPVGRVVNNTIPSDADPSGIVGARDPNGPLGWQAGGIETQGFGGVDDDLTAPTTSKGEVPDEIGGVLGTWGNDELYMTQSKFDGYKYVEVNALGGDDLIVRDRTGGYALNDDGEYVAASIYGGSGEDTVNYASAASRISVDLETAFGYGLANQILPAWATSFASDRLYNVENIVATFFDDHVVGDGEDNEFHGLSGQDTLSGGDGNDVIFGGGDNDKLYGGNDDDSVYAGSGDDTVNGGHGQDYILGGTDDDFIGGGTGADTAYGGSGDDDLFGGNGLFDDATNILGGLYNDILYGGEGDDDIYGGAGDDELYVGDGADYAVGHVGDDVVHVSGFGDNELYGGAGTDTLVFDNSGVIVDMVNGIAYRGTEGEDSLAGFENVITGTSVDWVLGTASANQIYTDAGADYIGGYSGHDELFAGAGNDIVDGGWGNDEIHGGDDDDILRGGNGTDTMFGDEGADRIEGGEGYDQIWTGEGPDVVAWNQGDEGMDAVFDFNLAQDKLSFGDDFFFVDWWEGSWNLSEKLVAFDDGPDTMLRAFVNDGVGSGEWQWIARLYETDHNTVNQMIGNGNILDVEVSDIGDGAPDGFDFG